MFIPEDHADTNAECIATIYDLSDDALYVYFQPEEDIWQLEVHDSDTGQAAYWTGADGELDDLIDALTLIRDRMAGR